MKTNPILGNGEYTLMITEDSDTKKKGLGIVKAERFKTFGDVGDRPSLEHIPSLDEDIDIIIHFENIKGLDALIGELEIIRLDMHLDTLGRQ